MPVLDPIRSARELREQLSSDKRRLGFFLGAGTSMAVGLPGIQVLTTDVGKALTGTQADQFQALCPPGSTVEGVLDRLRLYRELLGNREDRTYDGITGATAAKSLDVAICRAIAEAVRTPPSGLQPHLTFGQWLRICHHHRESPVELFTTNYDLNLERAMEACGVPFFDGFVGAVQPFFAPECVEAAEPASLLPPHSWTRLWKLHGSINWRLAQNALGRTTITRNSGTTHNDGAELAVFPARDKYVQSRRLPFVAFQDRLRHFIADGEALLVVIGYSFGDEHLNEIILQGLRSNPRAAVMALLYAAPDPEVLRYAQEHRNLALYGPTEACIGGIEHTWSTPPAHDTPCWNFTTKTFTLGDFVAFARFLETFIGASPSAMPAPAPVSVPASI